MQYLVNVANRPIFFLDSEVQGIVDARQAADVARAICSLMHAHVTVIEDGGKGQPHHFWSPNRVECEELQRLDREFDTPKNSPLHHDNRCEAH